MEISKKQASAVVAFALMLTMAVTLVALPSVSAHDPPWNVATFAFVTASPSPIGVGQTGTINMWIDKVPPTAYWQYGDRWENYKIELTDPNGDVETLGPFTSDDVGGAHTFYTPDTVGTYTLKFSFPGQTIEGKNPSPTGTRSPERVGDYYEPSSATCDWVVQEEPVEPAPAVPFPTDEYWTRPVYGQNAEWWPYVGDWLNVDPGFNCYNPYTLGPESAHVMWTYPIALGGVAGGAQAEYDWNYYSGLAYEGKFGGPIIMAGRLYIRLPLGTSGSGGGTDCVDLRTGELQWHSEDITTLSFGMNYDYQSPNEFGVKPYLVRTGSTYYFYDPLTGKQLFTIENASTGTNTFSDKGNLMVYILNGRNNWLALWNFSKCVLYYAQSNLWMWRPQGRTFDWKYGIEWNVTTNGYHEPQNQAIQRIDVETGVILALTGPGTAPRDWIMEIGYSTDDGRELWHANRTAPFEGGMISWNTFTMDAPVGDGVFVEFYPETETWYGYDITTGKRIWGPTEPYPNPWGIYTIPSKIVYGMLVAVDFGGYLHAYDIKTGELKWSYFAGSAGWDTPYGIYPIEFPLFAADGKIYVSLGHAYSPPIFKNARLICINATDGTLMWEILQYNCRGGYAIADGYITVYNIYDGQVYCFGKGPSATTVTAPDTSISLGQSVMIKGTVIDTCAGAQRLVAEGKFESVAAVSDDSQKQWMEYLYMQQLCPTNATGVEVTLDSVDPNGNFVPIGTATTDLSGTFGFKWEPPIPGKYTIIATFAGSKAYGPSYAETYVGVDDAPPEPTYPEPQPAADYTAIFAGIVAAVIIAIIIGIINLLVLRRRK